MSREMKNSGIPWIGEIPSHWRVETIGSCIKEVNEPNTDLSEDNSLQFKMGTIISKKNGDSKYNPDSLEAYNKVKEGDIIINGLNLSFDFISLRVGRVEENGVITSAYLAVRPLPFIDSFYLNYLFKGYDYCKALHSMGRGLRATLGYKEFRKYSVVFPDFKEQRTIADFLDRKSEEIDEMVSLQERIIEELKAYKQSVITEAITKGLNPDVQMKDSGVYWIGLTPRDWELSQLKRFCYVNSGREIEHEVKQTDENAFPVYGSGGVFKYTDKPLFSGETIMFGRKGTLGKPIYANAAIWVVDTMYFLTFKKGLSAKYSYYLLSAFDWEPYITHTAIPSIVATEITACTFPIPPIQQQQIIVEFLDKKCAEIDTLISLKQSKIEALKEYKKSIIYEYITGKKEVEA